MTTTRIQINQPRELLSYIPYRLGFHPRDSAVLVGLRGARSVVGLVVRVDLSDLADVMLGPQVARGLVSHVAGEGANRAVLVLYGPTEGAAASHLRAAAEHAAEAADLLLGEVPVWVVGPDGYRALDCDDSECCGPPGGLPLAELESTVVGATMVARGVSPHACREDVGRILDAPAPRVAQAARAAARWESMMRTASSPCAASSQDGAGTPDPLRSGDRRQVRDDALTLWLQSVEKVRAGIDLPATVLGRLGAALGDLQIRDVILVACVEPDGELARSCLADPGDGPSSPTARALDLVVHPVLGRRPDPDVAHREDLLRRVAGHARPHRQAAALTLVAILAWWQGDGARANVLIGRALERDPDHRLAHLVDQALCAGLPPGWARRPGSERLNLR